MESRREVGSGGDGSYWERVKSTQTNKSWNVLRKKKPTVAFGYGEDANPFINSITGGGEAPR